MPRILVVHIGSPKAGSSTIQETLFQWRHVLREFRILVPTLPDGPLVWRNGAQFFRSYGDNSSDFHGRKHIEKEISDFGDGAIVFSSESLFASPKMHSRISRFASAWADEVRIIAYIRDPASFYLSSQQQRVKAHHSIRSPQEWSANYATLLDAWRKPAFERFEVVPFDFTQIDQDLTLDMLTRMLPEYRLPKDFCSIRVNTSECAEISSIMQEYFRQCYPCTERAFRKDANRLRRVLTEVAETYGLGGKARLRPEVRQHILKNHLADIRTLSGRGIEWAGIDPGEECDTDSIEIAETHSFDDVAEVDTRAREKIKYLALQELARRNPARR